MSHILGLLFSYSRYKHDAVVRGYADDHLVDELSLQENISLKTFNYNNMPVNSTIPLVEPDAKFSRVLILPEKLFLFEIQDKYLNRKIRIEVENNYNNYTNGFMTQYSYINFHQVFLMPKFLMNLASWQRLENSLDEKYPDPEQYWPPYLRYEDIIIKSSSNPWVEYFLKHPRGGSFVIDIPLYKKHNIVHLVKPRPGRIWTNRIFAEILVAFKVLNTTK